jgi:hypothetical protein
MKHIIQTLFIQGTICISESDDHFERLVPCNHVECQRQGHDQAYRKFILDDEESCAAMTREKQSSIFSSLQNLKNVNAIFAGYIRKRCNVINNKQLLTDAAVSSSTPVDVNVDSTTAMAVEPTSSLSLYKQVLGHLEPSLDYLPGIIPGPITTRFSLKSGDLLHSQRHTPRIHRMLRHFNKTGRGGRSNVAAAASAQDDGGDDE